MFTITLKQGLRFKKDNKSYQVLRLLSNQVVEVLDEEFGDVLRFTQQELISSLSNNKLHFEVKGKNVKISSKDTINTKYEFNDIENLKHKDEAIFKYKVIEPLLSLSDRKEADVEKRVNEINILIQNPKIAKEELKCNYLKSVSRTSVYRWIKEYEEGNRDFRALIPSYHKCGGKSKSRSESIITNFINELINDSYLHNQRISKKDVWYMLINKITEYNTLAVYKLSIPSYSTVSRYINKIPIFQLISKRYSNRDAEKSYGIVNNGVKVSYPLERVEIDTQTLNIMIVGEDGEILGRPNFTAAIDKFTRCILGFHISFGKVGWQETMQCMHHIMSDKSYVKSKYPNIKNSWTAFGVPKTIVTDNGKEFKNTAMEDACLQLGIVLEYAPPRLPEWKGSIERFFGTSDTSFIHNLPGTTRSNPQQLAEGEKPTNQACLTFSKFIKLIHMWIIDVYLQDLNKGSGGIPSKIWDKYISEHPLNWPNSIFELAIALGKVSYRKIRRIGIELNNLTYNSYDLHKLFIQFSKANNGLKEDFKIKYNPADISKIFVYDHVISNEWLEVPSTYPEYTSNLSEWEHFECCKRARAEYGTVDIIALAKAKVNIYKEIADGIKYSKARISKAKKIDSSNVILNTENNNIDDPLNVTTNIDKNMNFSSVSDIGEEYSHSDQSNSIIISLESVKNNKNKKKKSKCENQSVITKDNLIEDRDFHGFDILYTGKDFSDD